MRTTYLHLIDLLETLHNIAGIPRNAAQAQAQGADKYYLIQQVSIDGVKVGYLIRTANLQGGGREPAFGTHTTKPFTAKEMKLFLEGMIASACLLAK